MKATISITNESGHTIPRVPFAVIKEKVLGKKYELSLAFIKNKISHKVNLKYRGKNKPTNVLSFPLSKTSGEILIDIPKTKKEALILKTPFKTYLKFIFIHGCLHLKGMTHGSKMEKQEKMLLAVFQD